MAYFETVESIKRDELFAGIEVPVRLENVSVSGGAVRGEILGGASGVFAGVSSSLDADKVLVIAAEDVPDTQTVVTSAYTSGDFNLAKLSTASSVVSASDFKENLRKVNIIISDTKQV